MKEIKNFILTMERLGYSVQDDGFQIHITFKTDINRFGCMYIVTYDDIFLSQSNVLERVVRSFNTMIKENL